MNREIVDALLTGMLESGDGVSDLLFVAGKPPLGGDARASAGFPDRYCRHDLAD